MVPQFFPWKGLLRGKELLLSTTLKVGFLPSLGDSGGVNRSCKKSSIKKIYVNFSILGRISSKFDMIQYMNMTFLLNYDKKSFHMIISHV